MPVDIFPFDPSPRPLSRAAAYVARPLLFRLAGLLPPEAFVERVLDALGITIAVEDGELDRIPRSGPTIIAANHPQGALDGLVLAALARRVRPDVRLVANYLLAAVPQLHASCFFVDPFEGRSAAGRSVRGLRHARTWLQQDGALIVFPAGEVTWRREGNGNLVERRWADTVGRLAASTGASVTPAFIEGTNSPLFYRAGRVHPLLRTALLPYEFLKKRNTRARVRFSRPLPPVSDSRALTTRAQAASAGLGLPGCEEEIARLPAASLLVDGGRYGVYCARAAEIPATLEEIGRLRAIAYRAAGEGTGTEVDLDEFDREYRHLFAWDRSAKCVVGAYRIGIVADLMRRRGVSGLYTRTLFEYGPDLIQALGPALELGRSFVRPEYQRNFQALLLLWRGIGTFVVRHPEHRVLFGPVSISGSYCDASHALLTAFLEQNHLDASLAALVSPTHPRPRTVPRGEVPSDADAIDRQIRELEQGDKGIPVLLRQYLKLNARALGFSVDPGFGHVLDALMAVDLTAVEPAVLRRYFGTEGMASYLAHHSPAGVAAA